MKRNLNDNEKRIRKRIIVTRSVKEGKDVRFSENKPVTVTNDPSLTNYTQTYRVPAEEKPINRFNPGEKKFGKDNDKRPYDPSKKGGFNKSRSGNDSKRKFGAGGATNNDPTSKHQFFKKHETEHIEQQTKRVSNSDAENELIRLNKFISNAGVCGRREADELIKKGTIKVNGVLITELGFKVTSKDTVEYKDKRITEANHVYILLNKPKDTITTTSDPENRVTVMDLVKKATEQRIFPIGRLDRNTTGVILLTNDGDFAQKLSHPSSEIRKIYYAVLDKPLEKDDFDKLLEGVTLEDGPMKVDEIAYVDAVDKTMIGVQIHSGKNRVVHRLFENLGYKVKKLDRVVYGSLDKGGLRRGKWRFLRYDEVQGVLNSIKYYDEKSPSSS